MNSGRRRRHSLNSMITQSVWKSPSSGVSRAKKSKNVHNSFCHERVDEPRFSKSSRRSVPTFGGTGFLFTNNLPPQIPSSEREETSEQDQMERESKDIVQESEVGADGENGENEGI